MGKKGGGKVSSRFLGSEGYPRSRSEGVRGAGDQKTVHEKTGKGVGA